MNTEQIYVFYGVIAGASGVILLLLIWRWRSKANPMDQLVRAIERDEVAVANGGRLAMSPWRAFAARTAAGLLLTILLTVVFAPLFGVGVWRAASMTVVMYPFAVLVVTGLRLALGWVAKMHSK